MTDEQERSPRSGLHGMRRRSGPRTSVPSKRIKAAWKAWRHLAGEHRSLKAFARFAVTKPMPGGESAKFWLANKGIR